MNITIKFIVFASTFALLPYENKLEIRKYNEKTDWQAVEKLVNSEPHWLYASLFPDKYELKQRIKPGIFSRTLTYSYVALVNNKIIGVASYTNQIPHNDVSVEIELFCIDKDYKMSNCGQVLLDYILKDIEENHKGNFININLNLDDKFLKQLLLSYEFEPSARQYNGRWYKLDCTQQYGKLWHIWNNWGAVITAISVLGLSCYITTLLPKDIK